MKEFLKLLIVCLLFSFILRIIFYICSKRDNHLIDKYIKKIKKG